MGVAALAVTTDNVKFPIPELGNCKDANSCKTYCDNTNNFAACVNYAEKRGMFSEKELEMSKKVVRKIAEGKLPVQCKDASSCEQYCRSTNENMDECISMGEELGMLKGEELVEAKKVAKAIKEGAQLPGNCRNKNECESYCSVGSHVDECLAFAEKSGVISQKELDEAKKVVPFLKKGETPGKCSNKAECDKYCSDSKNFDECIGFAEKVGFISKDDAVVAKKTGGKGPGGCKSKESCESFCNDPANEDACYQFAVEKDVLSEDQKKEISEGMAKLKDAMSQVPPEVKPDVERCLKGLFGAKYEKIMAGQGVPGKSAGEKIKGCFSGIQGKMMQKAGGEKIPSPPEGYEGRRDGQSGPPATIPRAEDYIPKDIPTNIPEGYSPPDGFPR